MLNLIESNSRPEEICRARNGFKLPVADVEIFDCAWGQPLSASARLRNHNLFLSLSRLPRRSQVRRDWLDGRFADLGDASLFPAREAVRVRSEGGTQRLMLCRFFPEQFDEILGFQMDWDIPVRMAAMELRDPGIRSTLARMSQEMLNPGLASAILVEALCTSLVVDLGRHLNRRRCLSAPEPGRLTSWQLRRIMDRAEDAGDLPALAEIAGLCRISVRQLVRAFKASTGETVHEFFAARQMDRARVLLSDSETSVKSIAAQLGFRHAASFTVAFSRACGDSPRAYRIRSKPKTSCSASL